MTTVTDDAPAATTEPPTDDRPCDACDEPGTTAELPMHGECLLRDSFGAIAEILTPEDVGAELDFDAGMTPRQSAQAVETLIDQSTADAILRGRVVEDYPLDERREMLAYLVACISEDLTRLEKIAPKRAHVLRVKLALRELFKLARNGDEDDDDDEDEAAGE